MNKFKLIISAFIITLVFSFVFFVTYNFVEPKAYDFMVKTVLTEKLPFDTNKKTYGSDDIVLVVVDNKTADKYRWPWKRELNCKHFNYFYEYAKPRAIADDGILTTLDIDSPASDRKFFNCVRKFDNMTTGFMPLMKSWDDKVFGEKYSGSFANKYSIAVNDKTSPAYTPYHSMLTSPNEYLASIKHIGHAYIPVGMLNKNISSWAFDNIIRTNEYVLKYTDAYYPSLALEVFSIINGEASVNLRNKTMTIQAQNEKRDIQLLNKAHAWQGFKKFILQTYTNPIRFYKMYNTGYSHIKYSTVDIMDSYDLLKAGKKPIIDPEIFKDKIVVFGANVPASAGLNDNKNSSIAVNHPGVDLQATVIDNLINNDFLHIIPAWFNFLITVLGMFLVYIFIRVFNLAKSVTSVLSINIGYLLFATICFYFGIITNVITPIVMFIVTTIFAYTHKFILENRSKEKVKSAMGKYMSEDVMKRVIQNIDNLGLGGKKSTVTVLFSDIRGFTSMSEQMTAQQVSEFLNEYFTEMEPIVTQYNGVINKFIGDAVMAIFGEPIQDKNHAENAVRCACAMLEKVKELQKKWLEEGKPKLEIGIGINTGEVFVGNIGSVNRMEYTVIGDTVNLASRLESYNKTYKTKLLISSSTYEEVKGKAEVIKISDVQIRGKANKMDIYEVLRIV